MEVEEQCSWSALQRLKDEASICKGKGGVSNAARIRGALERIEARSSKGLSPSAAIELASVWLDVPLPVKHWTELGCCLVPEFKMSDEVVHRVMRWIHTEHSNPEHSSKVTFALGWLQGLLEYNLIDINILDKYYELFFFALNSDKFGSIASKFVYLLTKRHDVTRARVLHLLRLTEIERLAKYNNTTFAIINLFKTFKPELVPESVPAVSVNSVFPKINKTLAAAFEQARSRCNIQTYLESETRLMWWKNTTHNTKKSANFLVPDVEYVHLSSSLPSGDVSEKMCIDFQNIKDLMLCNLSRSIDSPANALSLLINDAGFHLLMYSDDSLKLRFSQTLYHILHNNFLKHSSFSYEEKKLFLKRIVVFENYLMQGIPVVSRFLSVYISYWNGDDFFDEILSLLEWITFDSFDELFDCILEHIENLYVTNDVYYQCAIVDMLKRMYLRISESMTGDRKLFFPQREVQFDYSEVMMNLSEFISELCQKSSQNIYDSVILRNAYLDIFVTIADVELNCIQPIWTVAPRNLVYSILCSSSAYSINRLLGVILKYDNIYEKIKVNYGKDRIRQQMAEIDYYSVDFTNCLWTSEVVKCRNDGLLLKRVSSLILDDLRSIDGCDTFLDVFHHLAFAAYSYTQLPVDAVDISDKSFIFETVMSPFFPNISKFIEKIMAVMKIKS